MKKSYVLGISRVLLLAVVYQTFFPCVAWALTSGPSQPEVQSFEPVGTTDMVDLFSGDFVYNIPLLDVEGYPVNISYHGGANIEQEASWVGLGWNINPGVINHNVRGLPDDFNGEKIEKKLHIKPENNVRIGVGVGVEFAGFEKQSKKVTQGKKKSTGKFSIGAEVNVNNYKGVSAGFNVGLGVSLFGAVSAGVNIGVGSQTGADIDYNAAVTATSKSALTVSANEVSSSSYGASFGASHGWNSRNGLKDIGLGLQANARSMQVSGPGSTNSKPSGSGVGVGVGMNASVPIGLKNYVPVVTNPSSFKSYQIQIKGGLEFFYLYGSAWAKAMVSNTKFDAEGSRNGYGYFYLENAGKNDIVDFTRDKDGMFNKTMGYLPMGNMAYDVYGVSGQGTGGVFRPFRNDYGTVYDPELADNPITSQESDDLNIELGFGELFEAGGEYSSYKTKLYSGPWANAYQPFHGGRKNSLYEKFYFKQAGELTAANNKYLDEIGGVTEKQYTGGDIPYERNGAANSRETRASYLYFLDGAEASNADIGSSATIKDYNNVTSFSNGTVNPMSINRVEAQSKPKRRANQASEMVKVNPDGTRYIYGIGAMNNLQKEVTFTIPEPSDAEKSKGIARIEKGNWDSENNKQGIDEYYSGTVTPSYAHSYFLTSILSNDYVDVKGDGTTEDDLGSYTKFNYSLKDTDYRWRAPYDKVGDSAQYSPGFVSDKRDDKASYVIGSKEIWHLHSIESKNYVAEFYVSEREDGLGVTAPVVPSNSEYANGIYNNALSAAGKSFKLDSIVLYNKSDRFLNGNAAIPIKKVRFVYDYSLCPGTPNSTAATKGKLTLKAIYMSYGTSEKNLLSPYRFDYNNPPEYGYSFINKDRWGNYKPSEPGCTNYEFPFTNQSDPNNNQYAAAWQLTKIYLPSGGNITVNYEADDYAFVQNRRAMEMTKVLGVGPGKSYQPGIYQLYEDKKTPFLYVYFKRRVGQEFDLANLRRSYLENDDLLYYNFSIDVTGNDRYEPIKGYAEVSEVGKCDGAAGDTVGYIKLVPKNPVNSNATLHPATYVGLNVARYNLPHILFPGSDPDKSTAKNILKGIKESISELKNLWKNPLVTLVDKGRAKYFNKDKSYVRLMSPNLAKKGGGHRVKSVVLSDDWNNMSSNDGNTANYGQEYDYTIDDPKYGKISSGVASYEPMVGIDECPFKRPVTYFATSKSNVPPNDPVELYQEEPLGESLYPGASVGYSKVTVKSINKDIARSAQTVKVHEYYTAKDYPVEVKAKGIDVVQKDNGYKFGFFHTEQKDIYRLAQAYTLLLNDMHGKPKSTSQYVIKLNDNTRRELISSQVYQYQTQPGMTITDNVVPVLNASLAGVKASTATVGVEADVTIDSRERREETTVETYNLNVNSVQWLAVNIPIPTFFFSDKADKKAFSSVVTTKVIQKYAVLKSVETYNEGARFLTTNQYYDPQTGQVLVSKVNNEFGDDVYNVTYPAYWGYSGMGAASSNQGFEEDSMTMEYQAGYANLSTRFAGNYSKGDELMLNTGVGTIKVWVAGCGLVTKIIPGDCSLGKPCNVLFCDHGTPCTIPNTCTHGQQSVSMPVIKVVPRVLASFTAAMGTKNNVQSKIIRSGRKNILEASLQEASVMENPVNDTTKLLRASFTKGIQVKARTYSDKKVDWMLGTGTTAQYNDYVTGVRGNHRVDREFEYTGPRNYVGHSRQDGLFDMMGKVLWTIGQKNADENEPDRVTKITCDALNYSIMAPVGAGGGAGIWRLLKEVTHFDANGNELENKNAVDISSSAQFGYNNLLPTAVAGNARAFEILAEGFEDFSILERMPLSTFEFSFIRSAFAFANLATNNNYRYKNASTSGNNLQIVSNESHSGRSSLRVNTANGFSITIMSPGSTNIPDKFRLEAGKPYIISCWIKPVNNPGDGVAVYSPSNFNISHLGINTSFKARSNRIDNWQLFETTVSFVASSQSAILNLPSGYYYDDIRISPAKASMKAFVYNPANLRLAATLDENNFATFYEYNAEGQLIRKKKETERGILTIQESRGANPKK